MPSSFYCFECDRCYALGPREISDRHARVRHYQSQHPEMFGKLQISITRTGDGERYEDSEAHHRNLDLYYNGWPLRLIHDGDGDYTEYEGEGDETIMLSVDFIHDSRHHRLGYEIDRETDEIRFVEVIVMCGTRDTLYELTSPYIGGLYIQTDDNETFSTAADQHRWQCEEQQPSITG